MSDFPSGEELRTLVRQVLREALPTDAVAPTPQPSAASVIEPVSVRNDAELSVFVGRILDAAADPATAEALRTGRVRFVLAGAQAANPVKAGAINAYRVEKGAVTERDVKAAAESGGRLVLGNRAVLTPLAKDRARSTGVTIERES